MTRIFLAVFILISTLSHAQTQCTDALARANEQLNSGNVEKIPTILFDCIDQLSKENKVEAYKLLSIAYLYLDDPMGAETSFLALLEVDPEFVVDPNDPVELLYLSKQYITTPIISWAAKLGGNISTVSVIHSNSAEPEYNDTKYKPGGGFNAAGSFDLHFNKVVSLFVEAQIGMWQYTKTSSTFQSEPHDLESKRMNYQGSLPLGIKFTYPGIQSFPYIYGGYQPSYTYLSGVNDLRKPRREAEHEEKGLNLTNQINQFNQSIIVGIGFKRRIGKRFGYQYVLVDLRYRLGLTNITKAKTQFDMTQPDNRKHITKYLQVEDDFRWNSLELSFGYVWPKYKPRKQNSVTLQTTMKKWFGKKEKKDE